MCEHEWRFAPNIERVSAARVNTYGFFCAANEECREYILLPEAERRLNAVERLPDTLRLRVFAEHILEDPPFLIDEVSTILIELATALEGADLNKLPTQQKLTEEDMNDNQSS